MPRVKEGKGVPIQVRACQQGTTGCKGYQGLFAAFSVSGEPSLRLTV
ncbi:MAG: hypothetical protein J0H74_36825 [Chitinophagaceae bacterium]|nr:hypothetical protein [Chitinophagaceae bacterium]